MKSGRNRGIACVAGLAMLTVSCAGTSSSNSEATDQPTGGTVNPTYRTFCAASDALDEAMGGTHADEPTAITDPALMKIEWTTIIQLSEALRDISPNAVKADAVVMVDSMRAMNEIFKENKYDLLAMAKDKQIGEQLDALSSDPALLKSSNRFNAFLAEQCGKAAPSTSTS